MTVTVVFKFMVQMIKLW